MKGTVKGVNNPGEQIRRQWPQLEIRADASPAEWTTFGVGGLCPLRIDGPAPDDLPGLLAALHEQGVPVLVIGQGSNLVLSDAGLDRAVIRFCSPAARIRSEGRRITVSGDTLLDDLARWSTEHAEADLSFCSGIPGTVGGGLAGNAGAFGHQLGDHLIEADLLDACGTRRTVSAAELDFSYRHSLLKESGEVVLRAVFEAPRGERSLLLEERRRILTFRREHHPDWRETPCAGSVFRNIEPSSAAERRKAAGWFLEEAGVRDLRCGGARIYEKHANIIVADPGCTARDIWTLSEQMKAAVRARFGFDLIREVRFLGAFPGRTHTDSE